MRRAGIFILVPDRYVRRNLSFNRPHSADERTVVTLEGTASARHSSTLNSQVENSLLRAEFLSQCGRLAANPVTSLTRNIDRQLGRTRNRSVTIVAIVVDAVIRRGFTRNVGERAFTSSVRQNSTREPLPSTAGRVHPRACSALVLVQYAPTELPHIDRAAARLRIIELQRRRARYRS